MADNLKIGIIQKMQDVVFASGEKVVNTDDFMSHVEQSFANMGTEEAGAAGDEYAFFLHGHLNAKKRPWRQWTPGNSL